MKYEIPHADLIRAVLDGKVVQYDCDGSWVDLSLEGLMRHILHMVDPRKLRIKPLPTPVTKEQALAALDRVMEDSEGAAHDTLIRFIEEQS